MNHFNPNEYYTKKIHCFVLLSRTEKEVNNVKHIICKNDGLILNLLHIKTKSTNDSKVLIGVIN